MDPATIKMYESFLDEMLTSSSQGYKLLASDLDSQKQQNVSFDANQSLPPMELLNAKIFAEE